MCTHIYIHVSYLVSSIYNDMLCVYMCMCTLVFIYAHKRGAWVAQWVKASAFGWGCDPRVLGSSPTSGSLLSGEPASPSLSACLSAYL